MYEFLRLVAFHSEKNKKMYPLCNGCKYTKFLVHISVEDLYFTGVSMLLNKVSVRICSCVIHYPSGLDAAAVIDIWYMTRI